MKKTFLLCFTVFAVLISSCSKSGGRNVYVPELPKPVGEDEFAGKTFATTENCLMFDDGGRVTVCGVNYDENGEGVFVEDYIAEYSYDSRKKNLHLAAKNFYADGKIVESVDSLVKTETDKLESNLAGMIESGAMKVDDSSKKIYMEIIRKSYESNARTLLESSVSYEYQISDDGRELNLVQLPPKSARGCDMEGSDIENIYSINFYGNELVLTESVSEDEFQDQTVYYAFVEWDDGYTKFEGEVYSVLVEYDENFVQTIQCRDEGKITGTLKFSIDESDELYFYNAVFNFSTVPEVLKNLKSASLGDAMLNYNDSYMLVE